MEDGSSFALVGNGDLGFGSPFICDVVLLKNFGDWGKLLSSAL